ncbi:hypothetical protein [Paraburkholderia caballeronis]|uniref:Transmembrane protein n=1 Tax=Paraburkholderia caballeronis TaxID=416943 RepID=A0A1H7NFS7_9BURK|nr:hypothetical protein [Paraburkholderia caballeronis]PXW26138.1 hypothetical protein C7403_1044 [Paraburkholderia caballeronis]PXX01685.1 hypothetical protein C7407_1044 [Paraburkholderia caballeronis]RAK00842.1 hypothetical protein C7409_1044 [Paraburkholderia caballeronis]SEC12457.1 hypothetical protein SAMN05445871_1691 [Paraburkholderia caballeronis]SEL21757.1 hypothetical protein SAMN05192542_105465 [Paraburkholderia caballeronis]
MKPLLRVVLIVDALFLLVFGVLFLLTPWASLYDALQLVRPQPTLIGQAFGFVLIGLGWLAAHAAFDGALTSPIGKVVGHVNWIAGVLILVWLIGLHTPPMTGFGELVAGALGAWLIVLGLGGVRLARAVRRRDKVAAMETAAAQRDARSATVVTPDRREPVNYATPGYAAGPCVEAGAPAKPVAEAATRPAVVAAPPSAGTTAATSADTIEARNAARDEAAGSTKPPFHG